MTTRVWVWAAGKRPHESGGVVKKQCPAGESSKQTTQIRRRSLTNVVVGKIRENRICVTEKKTKTIKYEFRSNTGNKIKKHH